MLDKSAELCYHYYMKSPDQISQVHGNEHTARQILDLAQGLGSVTTQPKSSIIGNANGVHLELPTEEIVAHRNPTGEAILRRVENGVVLWKPTRAPRITGDINGIHIPAVGTYVTKHSEIHIETGINEVTGKPSVKGTQYTSTLGGSRSKETELSTEEIRHEAAKIISKARQEKAQREADTA